jgi:hypothetical protein
LPQGGYVPSEKSRLTADRVGAQIKKFSDFQILGTPNNFVVLDYLGDAIAHIIKRLAIGGHKKFRPFGPLYCAAESSENYVLVFDHGIMIALIILSIVPINFYYLTTRHGSTSRVSEFDAQPTAIRRYGHFETCR